MRHRSPVLIATWVGWILLAVTAGPALSDALNGRSRPVQIVASVALWLGWAAGAGLLLVPSTVSLTAIRCMAPAALAACVAAVIGDSSGVSGALAVSWAAAVFVLVFSPEVGRVMAQGSAYGDESRFLLRAPAVLLAGPIELAWVGVAAGTVTGPLLLASRQWVTGVITLLVGVPLAVVLVLRLHRLAQRWLVFVPAGMVLHDQVAMTETAMFRRADIRFISAASVDAVAVDATGGASGLVLLIELTAPRAVSVPDEPGRDPASTTNEAEALLVTPSQPGRVLAEAGRRGYPVDSET